MGEIQDGSAVFTVRDKRAQAFFDLVYPVGIVIALANDKKPAFMQYGTWEKVAEDRVLQGSSDSNAPGKTIEAGLPNITGEVVIYTANNYSQYDKGAFETKETTISGESYKMLGNAPNITFDASRSNEIYGKSETVQPPAYVVAYWQRTA